MVTPKKADTNKLRSEKKNRPDKNTITEKSTQHSRFFSWSQWSSVFLESINCWKGVIVPYILIVLLTLGLQFLGLFTLSATWLTMLGGLQGLENILANTMVGTLPSGKILGLSLISFLVWAAYAIYVGVLSKIAFYSIIKAYTNKNKLPLFKTFFVTGNQFFWRYIGLGLRIFAYILWPLLALILLLIVWDALILFPHVNTLVSREFTSILGWLLGGLLVLAMIYVLYASIRVLFAIPLLIQTGKKVAETFNTAKALTKGAWWFTFLMWGLFVILLYALNIVLAEMAYYDPIVLIEATGTAGSLRLTDLLAFFISLLIFGPVTTAFQYFLMLKSATNQSVKI